MKINISIAVDLTKEEVLQAITSFIREKAGYAANFPRYHEALDLYDNANGTFFAIWGEKPEPQAEEPETEIVPITHKPQPAEPVTAENI